MNESQRIKNNSEVIRHEAQVLRDKINNKISIINETSTILAETKVKLKNKYESMCELQDDSWLKLVELNRLDAILDDALNVIWNTIYKRNRTGSNMINIDKNKDIDEYLSKLSGVIINKIELMNRVGDLIDHIICRIKNSTIMIDQKIYKVSDMDNDTLHLINCKLKEFMSQLKQNLKKILV